MKIQSLVQAGNKPGKFIALFEDGTEIKVSTTQIADFGLYTGRELTEDEQITLLQALAMSTSKTRALRTLGNRNLSAREVERRLVGKGEPQEIAQETVRWLESIGAINDEEYAATIAKHYCAKGYGLARIKDELYRRGIPREIWDDALCGLDNIGEAAYDFLEKKLSGSRDKTDLRRATEALVRRGFSYDEARTVINQYLENNDENV